MDPVSLIVLLVVGLFVLGHIQRVRGNRAGRTTRWTIESTLPHNELHRMIVSALKGYSPVARVRGSLADGGYERRVLRLAMKATSKATAEVAVRSGGSSGEAMGSSWTVTGSISDWEIEHVGGLAHPLMSAPLAARRRLRGVAKAILKADPTALVLDGRPASGTDALSGRV